MAIIWSAGASKHGIDQADAVHAVANALLHVPEFDEPRFPLGTKPHLFIGPPRQLGGPLLEVMLEMTPPRDLLIFHVMAARPKFLALLEEDR